MGGLCPQKLGARARRLTLAPNAYRVEIDQRAERQLGRIGGVDRTRIAAAITKLAQQPRSRGALQLASATIGRRVGATYRRRVGNWRILYDIDDDVRVITILEVKRRNEQTYRRR